MRALLDTHALLWASYQPERLGKTAAEVIVAERTTVLVSAVSAWEIARKVHIGKLPAAVRLERDFIAVMQAAGYEILSISADHALRAGRLTGDHKDPFDRMLAAQALSLDIPIISNDAKLDSFGVRRIW